MNLGKHVERIVIMPERPRKIEEMQLVSWGPVIDPPEKVELVLARATSTVAA